nr:hypothetical protein [uncultured bacterium]
MARTAIALLGIALAAPRPSSAQESAVADAVVIVDTSTSMRDPGMDPERASLLVTKLLADIVPGDLAVVRLLDIGTDSDVIPSRETGDQIPCTDNPGQMCKRVEQAIDWQDASRRRRLGALVRPSRGDADYKRHLESHLEQRINNSMFHLAFRAAQGVFDEHGNSGVPRTVVWLSDGRSEAPPTTDQAIRELTRSGVAVEAIVFGQGDTSLARGAGLDVEQVSSPAGIMKAFAGAFRRIVQAPYKIDNQVSIQPVFDVKPAVDEAWVVVYGDDSLGEVHLVGPGGRVEADHAADRWLGAGAYRVAYLQRPAPGRWTVRASGGGPGVAYAVVQRSSLAPVLLEPARATSGIPVPLVAGLRAGSKGEIVTDPAVLRGLEVTAEVQGRIVKLSDGGTAGDAAAGDGRFTGMVTFHGSGKVPVRIRARSDLLDRSADASVEASGSFRYTGGPLEIDLGTLGAGSESCRPLVLQAEHKGEVPFELRERKSLPSGHRLEIRTPNGRLEPDGDPIAILPGGRLEVCLTTSDRAPSSAADGEPWLELRVAKSERPEHRVEIRLRWQVQGLSFWQRWGWLILLILAILAALFILLGFVLPQRFSGTLAVTYVPDRSELDEQSPQPVKQWSGVGIGFYRNARAFVHPDFRLSGKHQGALACLYAERGGARVAPGRGLSLFRETLEGDWETVPADGRRARAGDVLRIGDRGPYFRITTHRGRG